MDTGWGRDRFKNDGDGDPADFSMAARGGCPFQDQVLSFLPSASFMAVPAIDSSAINNLQSK
jgi:hypothetical protein